MDRRFSLSSWRAIMARNGKRSPENFQEAIFKNQVPAYAGNGGREIEGHPSRMYNG
jgi:hypothetical protein